MANPLGNFQNQLARKGFGQLYSSNLVLTGTTLANTQLEFFSYGLSQAAGNYGRTATLCETNLRSQGGAMSAQNSFMVHAIAFSYSLSAQAAAAAVHTPVSSADLHNLTDNGTLVQWVFADGTPIEIGGLYMMGAGGGVGGAGVAGTAGAAASELLMSTGIYRLPEPVPLYPQATFKIQLTFPTSAVAPTAVIAIRCTLMGEYGFLTPQG